MSRRILQAVPNFSEGRDLTVVRAIVRAVEEAGAEVFDWSADADHHRSVVTLVGTPQVVEQAVLAAARIAVEQVDLRAHRGVHPRVGALDVLPFVPLIGLTLDDTRKIARRIGQVLAEDPGVPVYFYGQASDPPGRRLAELRRGGFEAIAAGWPADRPPDLLPASWRHPGAHPTAGATCVGARPLLLAWNVLVEGVPLARAAAIASAIRETSGGFPGLRALALDLPERDVVQISMNLEDVQVVSPMAIFERIEMLVAESGGHIVETEVIGMLPDELLLSAAARRLRLSEANTERLLSRRLVRYLATLEGEPDARGR